MGNVNVKNMMKETALVAIIYAMDRMTVPSLTITISEHTLAHVRENEARSKWVLQSLKNLGLGVESLPRAAEERMNRLIICDNIREYQTNRVVALSSHEVTLPDDSKPIAPYSSKLKDYS